MKCHICKGAQWTGRGPCEFCGGTGNEANIATKGAFPYKQCDLKTGMAEDPKIPYIEFHSYSGNFGVIHFSVEQFKKLLEELHELEKGMNQEATMQWILEHNPEKEMKV